MNFLFLCGSLQPGLDGVGDYTRRISGALIRNGHIANVLSLCDKHVSSFVQQIQEIENTKIAVTRIPLSASYRQRLAFTQKIIAKEQPDIISLQFVPYSFNPKGLPFWMPSFLKKIRGNYKWHIMFHELWLGIDNESSLKHKFIGELQQLIVKKIINTTKTDYISTQIKLSQLFLYINHIEAEILPICGNIPVTAVKKKLLGFTQFVLFGTIHEAAPLESFIEDLIRNPYLFDKPIKFVFVGDNGLKLIFYTSILLKYNIAYEVMGIQSEKVISQVLLDSTFGISTTPYYQTEKSGVYAAYREHQLTTICIGRKWTPVRGQFEIPQIIRYKVNNLNFEVKSAIPYDLNCMMNQFLKIIS